MTAWLLGIVLATSLPSAGTGQSSRPDVVVGEAGQRLALALSNVLGDADAAAIVDLSSNQLVASKNLKRLMQPSQVGSLVKLVTSAAALQFGVDDFAYQCRGQDYIGSATRDCWNKGGHGTVHMGKALAESCNLYFHQLGVKLTPYQFLETLRRYGFGRATGYVSGESSGWVPDQLSQREVVEAAIGQGRQVKVTGLQALKMASILSGVGPLASAGHPTDETLRQAMFDVVQFGTGAPNELKDIAFSGKTGTAARSVRHWRINGWFAGFVPSLKPEYAFVLVAHNTTGSKAAQMMQKALGEFYGVAP